ncbi:hypothetical protein PUN28_006060 [Cardiocondyla obscurior]|uniref:Uncharacterized protein n=1 Tax=Cardiocondyla obscurior TaxID=286306 RepID=A0AAW2G9E3_9HYME
MSIKTKCFKVNCRYDCKLKNSRELALSRNYVSELVSSFFRFFQFERNLSERLLPAFPVFTRYTFSFFYGDYVFRKKFNL